MNTRYLWRSLLSVFVLWFALSPTLCYATETVTTSSSISIDKSIHETDSGFYSISDSEIAGGYLETYPSICYRLNEVENGVGMGSYIQYTPPFTYGFSVSGNSIWTAAKDYYRVGLYFQQSSFSNIVEKGEIFDLTVSGFQMSYSNNYSWSIINVGGGGGSYGEVCKPNEIFQAVLTLWKDVPSGTATREDIIISDSIIIDGSTFGIDVTDIEAPFDVKNIEINFYAYPNFASLDSSKVQYASGFNGWSTDGTFTFDYINSTFSLEIKDETHGLLEGIIDWLRSIRDGITGVGESITQLPNKIWTAMENGIKGLFIPSEQDMVAYKDKWDELLSQRFGVVYQSGTIITDTLGSITEQSAQGTINLPATTISFADTDFTFGGYDVSVVPQGFEWLVEIIKGVIDIVITVAFINAMRTKYDQLMRG